MQLENKKRGETVEPLETLILLGATGREVVVRDGCGHPYFRAPRLAFKVGGALGCHTVSCDDESGAPQALRFTTSTRTHISDASGRYDALLKRLHFTMTAGFGGSMSFWWNGRSYNVFIPWLRDHVHVLKGMKYFADDLKSGIDIYAESQRDDGMIWDNIENRTRDANMWDVRFRDGDFIRPFDDYSGEFKRIPVEADVEYLFVEGLFYTWKATGDDAWMESLLPNARRALQYGMSDRYRWSEKYQLIKRGHTIDTWDFQDDYNAALHVGDAMQISPDKSRFGIMFGDNTGYAMAFQQIAQMLEYLGRDDEAAQYRVLEAQFRERLDAISWNGKFFTHHVAEHPEDAFDLGVDEKAQVSLSNAYSLNRNLAPHQASAIIETYQGIKADLPEGAPGEWYTIYPPFERGCGVHGTKWQYVNGGVTPIVAGELGRGAFEYGYENYGVDILDRVLDLAEAHGGILHSAYTGAMPQMPARDFKTLDLSAHLNTSFSGTQDVENGVMNWTQEGENDLHEMPSGAQNFCGVDFQIADWSNDGGRGCIGLSTRSGYNSRVEIEISDKAQSIYFLHTTAGASGAAGAFVAHYDDGTTSRQAIVRGENASGWWLPEAPTQHGIQTVDVAWRGANAKCLNVGLIAYGWDNPHPEKTLKTIELLVDESGALWLLAAMTTSDAPANLGINPISFGIPNGWCAAAVLYALVEGLAGVVDSSTTFETAQIAPRWAATDERNVAVFVVYPASGGYVSYVFAHHIESKTIELEVTGSGEQASFHVLLPQGAHRVLEVSVESEKVAIEE